MALKNIAIVAGGDSGEYEVSLNSAATIFKSIDASLYNPFLIKMFGSDWFYETEEEKIQVNKNDFSIELFEETIHFDCVYIIIHGTPGEDGKLQGYFDMLKLPYTTCDSYVSALTFSKRFCKSVVNELDVLTPNSIMLRKNDKIDLEGFKEYFSLPLFVKPNAGGSSIGMSRVNDFEDLEDAIQRAFKEDDEVLVEEFIEGTEVTCGLLKNKNEMIVFPLTEIVSKKEFFDYEAKYTKGMADEITPARISEELSIECKRVSNYLYNKLGCTGLVRMDYIIKDDVFYFLEVNTVPGMSAASIVPQMAEVFGLSMKELVTMQIEDALGKGD
jgi:D-alanine-D-alanine ligase